MTELHPYHGVCVVLPTYDEAANIDSKMNRRIVVEALVVVVQLGIDELHGRGPTRLARNAVRDSGLPPTT